ncbi:hypothetical protein DRN73_04865 [Candidatus Pacearchaeota archaeon]|nr:MAG: hypothetical protein DRN73_04865 [Candidatus Pacearchaeota archaeon]
MKKKIIFLSILILLFFNLFVFGKEIDSTEIKKEKIQKILIIPFNIYAPQEYVYLKKAIPQMLSTRLFIPSKIEVIEIDEKEINNYTTFNKNIAKELGEKYKADYVIWGSITILGDTISIDAKIANLTGKKRSIKFYQEVKGVSEIIPKLTEFANRCKRYIEGKEEDFYKEEIKPYGMYGFYHINREHPEKTFYYYAPYLYPPPPPSAPEKKKPKVTKARKYYNVHTDDSLTSNLVIDLSKGVIGWAEEEKKEEKNKKNEENKNVNNSTSQFLYPFYPLSSRYSYSLPPYYYYYQDKEDEGFLSKLWSHIWPFGKKEKPKYKTQVLPAPQKLYPPQPEESVESKTSATK